MTRKETNEVADRLKLIMEGFVASDYRTADSAAEDVAEQIAEKMDFGMREILPLVSSVVSDRWFNDTPEDQWPSE